MHRVDRIVLLLLVLLLPACAPASAPDSTSTAPATQAATASLLPSETPTPTLIATPQIQIPVRFAVFGDYGLAGEDEAAVAQLVTSWDPHIIVTTGDNNYPSGHAATIDANIGQYYHAYIGNYQGEYGPGSEANRFFPSLGNHDWRAPNAQPHLDYFDLPGNERYYDVRWGPVHLFIVDSDEHEPDGIGLSSVQAAWLREALAASDAPWKLVFMHHPPYSSGQHGDSEALQWPYAEWGADAVLAGHDHLYERLEVDGIPYLISGLGGHNARYFFIQVREDSLVRYRDEHGAVFVEADADLLTFQFINVLGETIDSLTLAANP